MKYDWTNIYQEFANRLLDYKNNRTDLLNKLEEVYDEVGLKYPLVYKGNKLNDIDPFTIIGMFNKHITDENRIKIISKIKEKFNLISDVPTDFSGIPVINNQRAWFFGGEQDDIKNLWILFETALQFSDKPNNESYKEFCQIFDIVKQQRLIKWNITMGLFWIRPYSYLNLDSRNREYLERTENEFKAIRNLTSLKDVPNAEKYIEIIEECKKIFNMENSKFKNFIEFSDNAFFSNKKSNASFLRWFRPI